MICKKQIKINGNIVDSELYPTILKIMKDNPHLVLDEVNSFIDNPLDSINDLKENHYEQVSDLMYNYFEDSSFIDEFGDWMNNNELSVNKYDNGEPRLFYDKNLNKHYYRNKYNDKIYFPLNDNGLNYIYDDETLEEGVKYIANVFFKSNFNEDYNDLSFTTDESFKENIRQILMMKINEFSGTDRNNLAVDLRDSLYYLDEWEDRVRNYFDSLGFKIEESDVEIQNLEENDTQELVKRSSIEQDSKNNISANIKAFLSFIPDNQSIDYMFNETGFIEFEDIYNTLQDGLSDISPTIVEDNVEDTFNIMLNRIGELAHRKPYLKELLNILNNPSLSDSKKSQFTQAFSLVKNPYFVTEVDFKSKGLSFTTKDVSNVNANFNIINREWGFNFEANFLEDKVLNLPKLSNIKDNIKLVRSDFDKLRRTITDTSELEGVINNTIEILNDLGIETTEQGFNDYINNLEDTIVNIDELLNSINKILSTTYKFIDGINNKTIFYKDNKFINPLNKESLFKELAKSEAFYKPDGSDATIFSSGKSYWVYSLPSHLVGEINKWKSNIQELELLYNSDNGNGSKVLQYLLAYDQEWLRDSDRIEEAKIRIDKYKVGIFNALQNKKTDKVKSDPKNNVELSKDDAIIDSINRALLHNKEGSEERSLYNTPTPADKSTSYLLSHGYFLKSNISEMKDGKPIFSSEVINTYYDYFSAEYDRMYKAALTVKDENSRKIMYFHTGKSGKIYEGGKLAGNAFKSQIFEGLSPANIDKVLPDIATLIYNEDNSPALKSLDEYENQIKDYINRILQDSIINKINVLEANGILIKDDNEKGGYTAKGIDESIMKYYNSNYTLPVHNAIADYHLNTMLNNIEYSKMFSGDPAYYKGMVDYAKRIPATYTDGLQLRLKNNDDLTFNAAIISGVEISSRNLDNLKKLVGEEVANMYNNNAINSTDAQAWITPDRWKFLLDRLGLWTDLHESAFPKMMGTSNEPFTEKELKAVAQPLKGVYFKLNNGVPTYLKYSQAVLLPGLIEGSDLQKMYDKMVENEIDEVITLDGIKVGAPIPDTIHTEEGFIKDEFNLTPIQFDNRGWKLQQNLPTKTFKDTDVGSQIQKNALSGLAFNLDSEFQYGDKKLTGLELYKELNNIVGALSNNGKESLLNELEIDSTGKINNIGSLYNLILKEAKKRNINDNLIKALEKEISIYGIPQSHTKLMNMFFSIVKDRLVKIKTNGGSFIQVSNFGIDKLTDTQKTGIKWFIDPKYGLKPPHIIEDEEGNEVIKPGQILLPGSLIAKYIPDWKDIPADKLKEMIDPEILENIIGYRIPNQGLSSNDALEIVGFLPEGMGDAVVAYSEIPTKTGSDFDIDKMYMMIPSFFPSYRNYGKIKDYVRTLRGGTIQETINLINNKLDELNIPETDISANELSVLIFDKTNIENLKYASKLLIEGILNNDNELIRSLKKELEIHKVDKLIYSKPQKDDKGNDLPLNEQSKEVLQNKLIEAYKAIFTHPKVIRDVMTPIDFDYIKKDINSIFKDSSSKPDLHHFDSINQINLKYDFLAGKAGVGQTANMLVDHVRGMFIEMSLINTYIGRGHKNDKNETLFDREYSEELTQEDLDYYSKKYNISKDEIKNYKISNSISAFLNAFVDIAKDPYVTRGNWTTQTSNVGFMMLRAGIHPYIVNRFIGQPIIKEYINFVTNAESKFKDEKGNIRTLFLDDYTKKHNLDKNTFSKFDINNLSLKELDGLINNYNPNKQLKIIEKFFTLQDNSKKLIESINASKPDVTGAGKDLSSRFIIENLISELIDNEISEVSGSLRGFSNKLIDPKTSESTILGHYVDNSIDWTDTVLKANPKIFLLGNKNVENTFNILSNELRGSKLLNQDIADTLYKDFYSYIMSGFNGLKTENPALNLFVNLPKEVSITKQEDDYNFFLQQLELIEEDGITFIRLQNKKRSKNIQNKLYRGWKMLMEDRPELSKNLIKYSYYQSGFQNNINEFFSHIPHEYFVETKLNQYIYEVNNELNDIQYNFIEQFYKHNWNNPLIVPNLFGLKKFKNGLGYYSNNSELKELPRYGNVGNNLVKLAGYDSKGNGLYVITNKLGLSKNNGAIIEYKFDELSKKSQFGSNNPDNLDAITKFENELTPDYLPNEFNKFLNKDVVEDTTLNNNEQEFNDIFKQGDNKNDAQFQKLTVEEKAKTIEQVTKEHRSIAALKDLSVKLTYRIGSKVRFENRTDVDWKGYNQGNTSVLNEAYMTPDTPFHEILAHPLIRAIKNRSDLDNSILSGNVENFTSLYDSLLKELETGRGKEVFEQVKRDYQVKSTKKVLTQSYLNSIEKAKEYAKKEHISEGLFEFEGNTFEIDNDVVTRMGFTDTTYVPDKYYTLEEQQEEAIVTLLGLMAADKLDAKKDATLISKLKDLWKQISDFVKSLLKQDGIKIDELPITTTLNDLAEIMAYGNNKIILPGYKVEYSTPLGNKYDTLEEVNQEIRGLADANVEVDLDNINLTISSDNIKPNKELKREFFDLYSLLFSLRLKPETRKNVIDLRLNNGKFYGNENTNGFIDGSLKLAKSKNNYYILHPEDNEPSKISKEEFEKYIKHINNDIKSFIEKNKEYEQSKEIIEQWKKENNIQYDPEEVYSRGQGFYSSIGAYSNLELDLLFQNLLQHIQDNKKAGGEFTISTFTKPINKRLRHIEGTGDRVRFVIYPQSEHIKWAAPTDVFSGSVWDAHEKVSKDKKSELLGVSFTKAPSLINVNEVSPNLADIIDNLSHAHNELGIELTTNNFRIEYDDNIDYSTKKLIDNINKILDDKYGKIEKPEIKNNNIEIVLEDLPKEFHTLNMKYTKESGEWLMYDKEGNLRGRFLGENGEKRLLQIYQKNIQKYKNVKQPIQTRENTTSIKDVKSKVLSTVNRPKSLEELQEGDGFIYFEEDGKYFKEDLSEQIDIEITKEEYEGKKEYTSQALTNLKVAALKEVARKYPRSLITSKVVPINSNMMDNSDIQYSKKQGYSPVEIIDEYGNMWNEITMSEKLNLFKDDINDKLNQFKNDCNKK